MLQPRARGMSGDEAHAIGVVTVTFNSMSVLTDFFASINSQTFRNFTLFVIDNASQDGSAEECERLACCPTVVVTNDRNVGLAQGNNQGIDLALQHGCGYVLLLNNDTAFGPEFLALMHQQAAGHSVVAPKILYADPPRTIWSAGGQFSALRGFSGLHIGDRELDAGQWDTPREVEFATACALLIERQVFDRIGVIDARYFAYYDDTDFCFRLRKERIPIWYAPAASLVHKVSSLTGGGDSPFGARMNARNKVYYTLKHFGLLLRAVFLSAYLLYLLVRLILGKDTLTLSRIKVSAFFEGFHVASRPPLVL